MRHLFVAWSVAAACLMGGAACAQYTSAGSGASYNNAGSAMLDNMVWNRLHSNALKRHIAGQNGAEPTSAKSANAKSAPRITYKPTVKLDTVGMFARKLAQGNKNLQSEYARFLKEALASYNKMAADSGDPNDLGFSMAFAIGANSQIYSGKEVSDTAMKAMAAQMNRALIDMPTLAKSDDKAKQTVAETLVLYTTFSMALDRKATDIKNEEAMKSLRDAAGAFLKQMTGIAPEKLAVTETGLKMK